MGCPFLASAFTGVKFPPDTVTTSAYPPRPVDMDRLPLELIELIIDHLHDDKAALETCSLVSRVFLPRSQTYIFETIELRFLHDVNKDRNIDSMRTLIPPDPHGLLSHARKLSIPCPGLISPFHLEEILDYLMAFSNIRELKFDLDPSHFISRDLTLAFRYFSHFRPVLRSLDLTTTATNPKDLVVFLTFFPFLEDVSISFCDSGPETVPSSRVEEFDPNPLTPLRGALRVRTIPPDSEFIVELAKLPVSYHTLELGGNCMLPSTGIWELVAACAPTLRILKFSHTC